MVAKSIFIALIVGIVIGSIGTYYSNYILTYFGTEEILISFPGKSELENIPTNILPKTLLTNDLQYTLLEVKEIDFGINGEKPLEGGTYLINKVQIENLGKQEVIVFGKNWLLKDKNERIYTPKTFDAKLENNENIFSIRIPPGFKVIKTIGFEIPFDLDSQRKFYVADSAYGSKPILLGIV